MTGPTSGTWSIALPSDRWGTPPPAAGRDAIGYRASPVAATLTPEAYQ